MTAVFDAVIGVDPGGSGAAARITKDRVVTVFRFIRASRHEIRNHFNELFIQDGHMGFFEKVHAMSTDSRASANTFGDNTGYVKGLLDAYFIPFEEVDPKTWQREFGLSGKQGPPGANRWQEQAARKRAHKAKAQILFPEFKITLDFCDALLIAEWGWRKTYAALGVLEQRPLRSARGITKIKTNVRR